VGFRYKEELNKPNVFYTVQGWSSIIPRFSAIDFISFYVEIPVMFVMFVAWMVLRRQSEVLPNPNPEGEALIGRLSTRPTNYSRFHDLVEVSRVNLYTDEYEGEVDEGEDEFSDRLKGSMRWLWTLYYWLV